MLNTHEKNFRGIKKTVEQEVIDNQRKRIEYLRGQINNLKYELSGKTKKRKKKMILYADEFFEEYWKRRQYKHPEEKKKQKKIAKKFFTAGFNTGTFEERKEQEKLKNEKRK